jgi:hypothetical protein
VEADISNGPSKGEDYCRDERARLAVLAKQWGSIRAWRKAVFDDGGVRVFLEMQSRVIEHGGREPQAFGLFPARPPCGDGTIVTSEMWQQSPLAALGVKQPERLFHSFEVRHLADRDRGDQRYLVFRMAQDHNCDGVIGSTESEGYARLGRRIDDGAYEQTRFSPSFFMSE